jgi:uncharacterized OB-fold protein
MASDVLAAPYVLEYTYQRSTGPVIGRFLGALKERVLLGVRANDGRVLCPPLEYDEHGEATGEMVPVGPAGIVTVAYGGWALVKLDGADTAMLHRCEASTGERVWPRWKSERIGHVNDIECFASEPSDRGDGEIADVPLMPSPVRLEYTVTAGKHLTHYLKGFAVKEIRGGRCPKCEKVYLPPRGSCPTCGVPADEGVLVKDTGTVTTFCIIRIPFDAEPFPPPYAAVAVLLDGADMPIFHLLRGIAPEDVRMGMRVKAVWAEDLKPTASSVKWFEPSGEPDVAFETIARHL